MLKSPIINSSSLTSTNSSIYDDHSMAKFSYLNSFLRTPISLCLSHVYMDLCYGECYYSCLLFVCVAIYVSLFCVVSFVMVNCLLNAFAICLGEVTVFSLKFIVLWL